MGKTRKDCINYFREALFAYSCMIRAWVAMRGWPLIADCVWTGSWTLLELRGGDHRLLPPYSTRAFRKVKSNLYGVAVHFVSRCTALVGKSKVLLWVSLYLCWFHILYTCGLTTLAWARRLRVVFAHSQEPWWWVSKRKKRACAGIMAVKRVERIGFVGIRTD